MTNTNDNGTGWQPGDENTLSPDQQSCIALLEMTLAEAKKGTFHALAIAGVTANGFGSQVAGTNVPALYMCMGMQMSEFEAMCRPAAQPAPMNRPKPTIIRPGQR